ncbi:MAG: hypothetical protein L6Q97_17360 [Thermoanaerobaculia bacterium]|nr:hypothetical protein [Thermoanaerobaculia bacterium]
MTQVEIERLTVLISQSTEARPQWDPEDFMTNLWRPFLQSLPPADRRIAWQLYLKAQVKHLHAIVECLQTLSPAKIRALTPALEQFVSISASIRNWGEEPVSA